MDPNLCIRDESDNFVLNILTEKGKLLTEYLCCHIHCQLFSRNLSVHFKQSKLLRFFVLLKLLSEKLFT